MNTSMHSSLCLGTKSVLSSLALCLGLTQLAHADSLLVGTLLSGYPSGLPVQGGVLCASGSGCNVRAQQFTLNSAAEVSQIQVVVSGPVLEGVPRPYSTPVTLTLGTQFPTSFGQTFWTGTETFQDPDLNTQDELYTELLTFDHVNTHLAAGTYYLQMNAGDLAWGSASNIPLVPLGSAAGVLGSAFTCDPDANCSPSRTNELAPGYLGAVDIRGTAVSPEPSTIVLSATGLVGLCCMGWSRALHS